MTMQEIEFWCEMIERSVLALEEQTRILATVTVALHKKKLPKPQKHKISLKRARKRMARR